MVEGSPSGVPREDQTIRLLRSELDAFREWATDGTALTAAARVRDRTGRIALVRNGWSDGWLPPGGAVEAGETPPEAARREVREETGLAAAIGPALVVLDQTYVDPEGHEHFSARYIVYDARGDGAIPDASELGLSGETIRDARWFDALPEHLHDDDLLRSYLRP